MTAQNKEGNIQKGISTHKRISLFLRLPSMKSNFYVPTIAILQYILYCNIPNITIFIFHKIILILQKVAKTFPVHSVINLWNWNSTAIYGIKINRELAFPIQRTNCVYLIPINSFTVMRRKWKRFYSVSTKTQQVIAHCWLNTIQLFYPNTAWPECLSSTRVTVKQITNQRINMTLKIQMKVLLSIALLSVGPIGTLSITCTKTSENQASK